MQILAVVECLKTIVSAWNRETLGAFHCNGGHYDYTPSVESEWSSTSNTAENVAKVDGCVVGVCLTDETKAEICKQGLNETLLVHMPVDVVQCDDGDSNQVLMSLQTSHDSWSLCSDPSKRETAKDKFHEKLQKYCKKYGVEF